jgi:hypothetical protein
MLNPEFIYLIRPKVEFKERNSGLLTKAEKEAFFLSQELKDILIGLLLGDLYVEKQKGYKNARLQFKQSTAHKEYLDYLYDLFKEYSGSKPKITFWFDSRPDRNKEYSSMKFGTYSLPCFNAALAAPTFSLF